MISNPPTGSPAVLPMLSYANAPAAIDFLCKAFGFVEKYRLAMPDGSVGHAELDTGLGGRVALASEWPDAGLVSPKQHEVRHSQLMVYVEDVDAHCARAKAAGATIATEPEDQFYGDRMYRSVDLEGHRWIFATHVRNVSEDEMQQVLTGSGNGSGA